MPQKRDGDSELYSSECRNDERLQTGRMMKKMAEKLRRRRREGGN